MYKYDRGKNRQEHLSESKEDARRGLLLTTIFHRAVESCAAAAGVLALLVLLGWLSGNWRITTLGYDYVPMSPGTALSMILLSCGVFAYRIWPSRQATRRFAFLAVFSVAVVSLLTCAQLCFDFESPVDRWLAPAVGHVGDIAIGRMSPLTAVVFLFCAWAFCLSCRP